MVKATTVFGTGRASSLCIASGGQFADEYRFDNVINLPEQVILWNERLQINDRPSPGLKDMQSLASASS
ncbi:hypothetical protein [Gimesia aquarii]|uniref:hypothetical protein n=1 Tax=Gimesia aquarii TaxID=2527964 RepID=UPI0011A08646|nr:hypothetical protein [Gimesia aquarii]